MIHLAGQTADEVWRRAASLFVSGGPALVHDGRGGETLEVLHAVLAIRDPRQRWALSRVPALNPAFALVEAVWVLAGRRDAALPTHWNPRLPRFVGGDADLPGAYGYRLRFHFGLDQLDQVYRALDSAPATRQAVLQIWDAASDLPAQDGAPRRPDIPCNVVAFPKVRSGRLEWLQVLRSNDVFLGLPYNIVQFTVLQEVLAGWLGVEMGEYVHVSDSLHAYTRDVESLQHAPSLPAAPILSTDSLALDRTEFERVLAETIRRLENMADRAAQEGSFRSLALEHGLPEAYHNIVRIAGADSARKRGWTETVAACRDSCTNPLLREAWDRWSARNARQPQ